MQENRLRNDEQKIRQEEIRVGRQVDAAPYGHAEMRIEVNEKGQLLTVVVTKPRKDLE